jgi:hypothetical protein
LIRSQRSAHARIWIVLAVIVPLALLLILANAPGNAPERLPERLDSSEAGG